MSETHATDAWVGVISDTHGLLRPEAIAALTGAELIVHAGDVGPREILERLGALAPVRAVRGNVDRDSWCRDLPTTDWVAWRESGLYVVHDVGDLDVDPAAAGVSAVIHGHSHRPGVERLRGVLYVNPGSAGPRRFSLPVTLARLRRLDGTLSAEIVSLES